MKELVALGRKLLQKLAGRKNALPQGRRTRRHADGRNGMPTQGNRMSTEKKVFARTPVLTPNDHPLLPRLRPRHRPPAGGRGHRALRHPRADGVRGAGRLLGAGLPVHRHRHVRGGPRPAPRRWPRASSGHGPTCSCSPTRATATWRPSARPRSSTPPIAARTSR